jgi:nitroreductase
MDTVRAENLTRMEIAAELALASDAPQAWAAVTGLLLERYSCRAFRSDPVPRDTIARILAAAQLTASWCNAQPWEVIVTEGEGTERFRAAMLEHVTTAAASRGPDFPFPERYEGVHDERRKECGWALYESVGVVRGDRAGSALQMQENFRLFGAPHLLILTSAAELGTYGAVDCGLYLGNLMLLMQSFGVASIAQAALATYSPFVRDHFAIPESRRILVGMSFGYPDAAHRANGFRTRRASLERVVRWVTE